MGASGTGDFESQATALVEEVLKGQEAQIPATDSSEVLGSSTVMGMLALLKGYI